MYDVKQKCLCINIDFPFHNRHVGYCFVNKIMEQTIRPTTKFNPMQLNFQYYQGDICVLDWYCMAILKFWNIHETESMFDVYTYNTMQSAFTWYLHCQMVYFRICNLNINSETW